MISSSFSHFVEQDLGKVPHFIIYAVLELILICLLLIDGFLAFFAHEFARIFELELPCTLCTRIDQNFIDKDTSEFYHESICEGHKKEISSLAYCQVHQKLSCLRTMCEGCLLGYAPEQDDGDHKNVDCLFDDELRARLMIPYWKNDNESAAEKGNNNANLCSCCGEPMKIKSSYPKGSIQTNVNRVSHTPMPSPRTPLSINSLDFNNLKLSRSSTLKMSRSNTLERDRGSNLRLQVLAPRKEDIKTIPESDALPDDHTRLMGMHLPDSSAGSPRFANKTVLPFFSVPTSPRFANRSTPPSLSGASSPRFAPRKSMLERMELAPDSFDNIGASEPEDSVLNRLKTQVKLDQKSLVALYMELDEERSAAAVAANNAMAMITRLQAEKAAVQMEALQYQRMMDEQAEYDQEALLSMKDLLDRREDEMRELEAELQMYRERHGILRDRIRFNPSEKLQSFESFTEGIERGSHHDHRSALEPEEFFEHEIDSPASFCTDAQGMGLPDQEEPGYTNIDGMLSADLEYDISSISDQETSMEVAHSLNERGDESSTGMADMSNSLDLHSPTSEATHEIQREDQIHNEPLPEEVPQFNDQQRVPEEDSDL